MSGITPQEMKAEVTVTFMMPSTGVFDHKHKKDLLERFARLSEEKQKKLEEWLLHDKLNEEMKALPVDDCKRIMELIENPKALKKLKENWTMLKAYIGV